MALTAAERQRRHRARRRGEQVDPSAFGSHHASLTECPQGHPYDAENTYFYKGSRQCKTCRRAHGAKWRIANPDDVSRRNRAHYAANREARLAYTRAWARANPERAALTSRLKKQRRRAAGTLTAAEWLAVLDLYGRRCLACGSDDPPTIDHVVPVVMGGSNTVDNVQPLCGTCNSSKATQTIDYRPALVEIMSGE